MSEHDKSKTGENILEYRITKLEEAVSALASMKDMVMRWDARFGNNMYLQCPIHQERMENIVKRMDDSDLRQEKFGNDMDTMKRYVAMVIGGFAVAQLVITLFVAPYVGEWMRPNDQRQSSFSQPSTHEHFTSTTTNGTNNTKWISPN